MQGRIESRVRALREAASHAFKEVRSSGSPLDRIMAAYFREHHDLGSRDRRLIGDMIYASFRWWGWLYRLVPQLAPRAAESYFLAADKKSPDLSSPDFARILIGAWIAENCPLSPEAEALASTAGVDYAVAAQAAGVLVAADRVGALLDVFGIHHDPLRDEDLLPAWVVGESGDATLAARLATSFQTRAPLWLRVQRGDPGKTAAELWATGVSTEPAPAPFLHALRITCSAPGADSLACVSRGDAEIQDLASQAVGIFCAPKPGEHWWDACAGAGGKSLHLARLLDGRGSVFATDVRAKILGELQRRARRGGFANIRTGVWDGLSPTASADAPNDMDGVLVDAPCSGSGTWRRNPAARWTLAPAEPARYALDQVRLLCASARAVKRGGVLLYATCSIFPRENEAVAAAFQCMRPDFIPDPAPHPFEADRRVPQLNIRPWDGDCDGMFVARFRRSRL